jgi:E3 ubiquitin-protein transferase RMND5
MSTQAQLKELDKLQKLTSFIPNSRHANSSISLLSPSTLTTSSTTKGKQTVGICDTLDGLLASLRDIKERVEAGTASDLDVANLTKIIEERRKDVDDRQKEIHGSLGRIGKALDKVTCTFHRIEAALE